MDRHTLYLFYVSEINIYLSILHSEWQVKILEMKRKCVRVMSIKLIVGKRMLNIISAYALQTGCSKEEKEHFYEEMESLLRQRIGRHVDTSISKWPCRRNENRI